MATPALRVTLPSSLRDRYPKNAVGLPIPVTNLEETVTSIDDYISLFTTNDGNPLPDEDDDSEWDTLLLAAGETQLLNLVPIQIE